MATDAQVHRHVVSREDLEAQDRFVREAIETDSLLTKEHCLRKKLLEGMMHVPRLRDFPYLIDVEYLCVESEEGRLQWKAGQGDLLLTDGNGRFVAVEIKSCFVCYDGSDRIYLQKMTKLLEQIQSYMAYQQKLRPGDIVFGCGVTEQKIYWIEPDGKMEEFWWSSGPRVSPYDSGRLPGGGLGVGGGDPDTPIAETLPDVLLDVHIRFMDENIARVYPTLVDMDLERGTLTYVSKCKQRRMTVCQQHVSQDRLSEIVETYRRVGCSGGHILMFGLARPTIVSV